MRYQGNWFPHALREAAIDGAFCAGDSAGHCFPLSGEGIRTAFYFGIACGRLTGTVKQGFLPPVLPSVWSCLKPGATHPMTGLRYDAPA